MSAEILHRAAEAIRKDQDIEEQLGHIVEREFKTWLAVADWLDDIAHWIGFGDAGGPRNIVHALAVARAYLGEQP